MRTLENGGIAFLLLMIGASLGCSNPIGGTASSFPGAAAVVSCLPGEYQWDLAAALDTISLDGTGTWDTNTTSNWTLSSGATLTQWGGSGSIACFGSNNGAAGVVTVSGTVATAGMDFVTPGSGTYFLSGGILNLDSSSIIRGSTSAEISSVLAGTSALSINNFATTTLSGINTYTGGTTINAGTLVPTNTLALGRGSVVINNGGVLSLNLPTIDFSNSANWVFGETDARATFIPTMNSGTLMVTDNTLWESTYAYFKNKVDGTGDFLLSVAYQLSGDMNADGSCLIIQNSPGGTSAIGAVGNGFGYRGITHSVALCIDAFNFSTHSRQVGIGVNGVTPTAWTNVDGIINPGNPVQILFSYSASTHVVTYSLQDTLTLVTTGNLTYTLPDSISNILGGGGAGYLGITAATGGQKCTQTYSNFSFATMVFGGNSITVNSGGTFNKNGFFVNNPIINNGGTINP